MFDIQTSPSHTGLLNDISPGRGVQGEPLVCPPYTNFELNRAERDGERDGRMEVFREGKKNVRCQQHTRQH